MSKINDGGMAFPGKVFTKSGHPNGDSMGMSKREYFAGLAMQNPEICTGTAGEYYIKTWFGGRSGIAREEIAAKQAVLFADAILSELAKGDQP